MANPNAELAARVELLAGRIRSLEKELHDAQVSRPAQPPPAPKPPPGPPAPPKWATQSGNTGMLYGGEPTVSQASATGIVGVKPDSAGNWRDASNHLRDASGAYVTPLSTERPIGRERDPLHQQSIELLDRIVDRLPAIKETDS
jgi:hypothetical protein